MNNINDQPTPEEPQILKGSNSKYKIISSAVILLLLIGGAAYMLMHPRKTKDPLSDIPKAENVINREDINLSAEQRQKLESTVADLENRIKNLPGDAPAEERADLYINLAEAKHDLGLYLEAFATLNTIVQKNKDNPKLWYTYAIVYRDMGELAKARESARRAADTSEDKRYWLTYIDLSNDQGDAVLNDLYQQAVVRTKNDINVITDYARFLEKTGNIQAAIENWTQAGIKDPEKKAEYDSEIARLQKL